MCKIFDYRVEANKCVAAKPTKSVCTDSGEPSTLGFLPEQPCPPQPRALLSPLRAAHKEHLHLITRQYLNRLLQKVVAKMNKILSTRPAVISNNCAKSV